VAGSGDAVILTEDLTKVYRGSRIPAVDGLDLAIRPGEIFGLLGPNGAGKTTTAGMLTTRVVPTRGRAVVGGVDVVAHPARAKQLTGIVSQQNTLDRQLTVWENLYLHGRLFGITGRSSRQIADSLLERFELSRWASASVYALSGGMAQRLMVARAVFHRPAVLFLDEPTAGLDPQSRLALWDMLGELHGQGQTVVLTTHNMDEAERLCQRVAIIDQGRIVALDTPEALKQRLGADTMVSLRADTDPDSLSSILRDALPEVSRSRALDGGVEVSVTSAPNLLARVVNAVEAAGHTITDLSVTEPTLETVFIHLTGKELREK
jgi:ABC-2 type transport system ATP-binding protein